MYFKSSTKHNFFASPLLLDSLCFLPVPDYIIYQSSHAFFAFEAVALDAFKALSIWFLPKLFFFVGQHHYIILLLFTETLSK